LNSSLTIKIDDYCTYVSRAVRYYKEGSYSDSASNCRKAAEAACKVIIYNAYAQKLADTKLNGKSLKELIILLIHEGLTERKAINTLETLQIIGNRAAHDNPIGKDDTIYAINALNLFNEYLFKEYLKIRPPQTLDFNIGEPKEKIIHTKVIKETIVQEKFNKEAEEQIFSEIKKIHEKNEGDATRFEDLKKEIARSHEKIDELSRQKETEVQETKIPEKKNFFTKARIIIASLVLVILIIIIYFLNPGSPANEEVAELKINKHPDSIYVAINAFQIMQDNPSVDFKIEERLFTLINNHKLLDGLPVSILYTTYKSNGDPYDSLMVDKAGIAGFDVIYFGNLYETSLTDSNILEIRGSTTKLEPRTVRDKKIKFKILTDSTFIKEVNDQTNLPIIYYMEERLKNKPSSKWLKVVENLRTYSMENWLAVKTVVADLKTGLNDLKGALADIEQMIKRAPNAYNITYKATLLGRLKQPDSAKVYFERALRMDSTGTYILFNYASFCFETGDLLKSGQLLQRAILINPKDFNCYSLLAYLKTQERQYALSKSYALKANSLLGGNPRNNVILADIYAFAENKTDSAEYYYAQALGRDSSNIEALTHLVNYYQNFFGSVPEYKIKIDYLLEKVKMINQQNDIQADFSMGLVAFDRKDYKTALKYFEKVYAQKIPDSRLFTSMAQAYYRVKQLEKALAFSKMAVELDSLNANNLTIHAYLLSYITPQDYKTCAYYFDKAMKANSPTFLDIYQQYGVYLSRHGKIKESVDLALKGHKLFPTDLRMNSLLAYGYFELKNFQKAKPYFEYLISQVPNDDTLLYSFSQCILQNFNGTRDETFAYGASLINKALQINPNQPDYLLIYSMYFLKGGNPELASKFYIQAKEFSNNVIYNKELEEMTYKK